MIFVTELTESDILETTYDQLDNIRFLQMFLQNADRMFRDE